MSDQTKENMELRDYLLGNIQDPAEVEEIDEQLMLNDDYFKELLRHEDDLIQEYADQELTTDEQKKFEEHFLISEERLKKLEFAKALRKYVNAQEIDRVTDTQKPEKRGWKDIFNSLLSPLPVGVGLAAVIFASLFIWYLYSRPSAAELAINSLNRAYQQERPFESRVTNFDYAPFYKTRGEKENTFDIDERNRAELDMLNEIRRNPTAENFHALGQVELAKKDFDKAIERLEKAKTLDSQNAQIFNDLGVAYLEKYKISKDDKNSNIQLGIQALDIFDNAIKLNPRMKEAYFNRADSLQTLNLPNEAKEAWKKYLELDESSRWAEEARKRLELLESQTTLDMSADKLERAFLDAFEKKNDNEAFLLASRNRELISEHYLPQKLAFSIVNSAPVERAEKLKALQYLGELEKEQIGDNFASDLATFYAAADENKIELLKKAQAAIREGYEICLNTNNFVTAIDKFKLARQFFLQAGNIIEAKTVSNYFIAYCLYYLNRFAADKLLKEVGDFTKQKNYRWFALMNHYWWLGSQEYLGYKSITETRIEYENALKESRNMGDFYMMQKFLLSLLLKSNQVKQEKETYSYVQKLLEISTEPNLSIRQKNRGLGKIIRVLSNSRYTGFSNAVMRENVALSKNQNDPGFVVADEIDAGVVNTQAKNFEEAEQWFSKAIQEAETLPEEPVRTANLAAIFLNLGHLEKKRNDLHKAADYYARSLEFAEKTNEKSTLYEIKKSRLFTFQSLEMDEEIDQEIPSVMQFLTEDYRKQITTEEDRNTFFDTEQPVYDIAIDHEMHRNNSEQAYYYAEISSARSLLDWMEKGAESNFSEPSIPLNISQIRENMPAEVQILQFRVLEDRVLIWLVSKETFLSLSSDISLKELEDKTQNYLDLIKANKPENLDAIKALSRDFYNLLIKPMLPYLDKSKQICLIPNKILFRLPFSAFISPDEKYFLEEFTFFYSPSASVFIQCTKNAKEKAELKDEKLLSVGNPAFDKKHFPDLEDLSEAKTEALEIRKNYAKSEVLTEFGATKSAFLGLYKDFEVIHIAGHYIIQPDSPLLSKLIMAKNGEHTNDDFITNMELRGEKLPRTKLVVLSACQTGVEGYYNSEGLAGLSRTFLAAGVPLAVASAWQVESEATSLLMKNFHHYRQKKNLSSSQALRQAQLDLLKADDEKFNSAYFWAAFSVYGGYTEF